LKIQNQIYEGGEFAQRAELPMLEDAVERPVM